MSLPMPVLCSYATSFGQSVVNCCLIGFVLTSQPACNMRLFFINVPIFEKIFHTKILNRFVLRYVIEQLILNRCVNYDVTEASRYHGNDKTIIGLICGFLRVIFLNFQFHGSLIVQFKRKHAFQ